MGTVAGSSVLGMLIPPSVLFILYGILANESIGALYIAGIIPGLILTTVYIIGIILMIRFRRELITREVPSPGESDVLTMSVVTMVKKGSPIAVLVILVLGGIYIGFFTPTEAGAAGAFMVLMIGVLNRRLTLRDFWQSLLDTGYITSSILLILVAAQIYSRMLTISTVPNFICDIGVSLSLPPILIVLFFMLVLIGMGCFLDSTSILLIAMPIMVPVVKALGYDLIWFAIPMVLLCHIAGISPPCGITLFVLQSLRPNRPITEIYRGLLPFGVIIFILLGLMTAFPRVVLFLPELMMGK